VNADRVVIATAACLVLGLVSAVILDARRRRLPPDLTGQVTADAYRAIVRALLVLLAGLALALGAMTGRLPVADLARGLAVALVAIGGIAVLARTALYLLRIKPELDQLRGPMPPAAVSQRASHNGSVTEQGSGRGAANR
jgi:hypothetical protein